MQQTAPMSPKEKRFVATVVGISVVLATSAATIQAQDAVSPQSSTGDATVEVPRRGNETSLKSILDQNGYNLDTNTSSSAQQTWEVCESGPTTITTTYLANEANYNNVFGVHDADNLDSFNALFSTRGEVRGYTIPAPEHGETVTTTIDPSTSSIAFALESRRHTFSTQTSLNADGADHAVTYQPAPDTTVIAFEDQHVRRSDNDYNDLVVEVAISCDETPEDDLTTSAPNLTSLTPTQGPIGTEVSLEGSFPEGTDVRFNGGTVEDFTIGTERTTAAFTVPDMVGAPPCGDDLCVTWESKSVEPGEYDVWVTDGEVESAKQVFEVTEDGYPIGFPHPDDFPDDVPSLTELMEKERAVYESDPSDENLARLRVIANKRLQLMTGYARNDTDRFLSLAQPATFRDQFPEEVRRLIEERRTITGEVLQKEEGEPALFYPSDSLWSFQSVTNLEALEGIHDPNTSDRTAIEEPAWAVNNVVVLTPDTAVSETGEPRVASIHTGGDQNRSCRLIVVEGINSDGSFSAAVEEVTSDVPYHFEDDYLGGVDDEDDFTLVRSTLWDRFDRYDENVLIAAHSLGSIVVFNAMNQENYDADILLYDPPYASWLAWTWFADLFNDAAAEIQEAYNNGIADHDSTHSWTDGKAKPDDDHNKFNENPWVLSDIPDWLEENCPRPQVDIEDYGVYQANPNWVGFGRNIDGERAKYQARSDTENYDLMYQEWTGTDLEMTQDNSYSWSAAHTRKIDDADLWDHPDEQNKRCNPGTTSGLETFHGCRKSSSDRSGNYSLLDSFGGSFRDDSGQEHGYDTRICSTSYTSVAGDFLGECTYYDEHDDNLPMTLARTGTGNIGNESSFWNLDKPHPDACGTGWPAEWECNDPPEEETLEKYAFEAWRSGSTCAPASGPPDSCKLLTSDDTYSEQRTWSDELTEQKAFGIVKDHLSRRMANSASSSAPDEAETSYSFPEVKHHGVYPETNCLAGNPNASNYYYKGCYTYSMYDGDIRPIYDGAQVAEFDIQIRNLRKNKTYNLTYTIEQDTYPFSGMKWEIVETRNVASSTNDKGVLTIENQRIHPHDYVGADDLTDPEKVWHYWRMGKDTQLTIIDGSVQGTQTSAEEGTPSPDDSWFNRLTERFYRFKIVLNQYVDSMVAGVGNAVNSLF